MGSCAWFPGMPGSPGTWQKVEEEEEEDDSSSSSGEEEVSESKGKCFPE